MVFCDLTVTDFNRGRLYQRTSCFTDSPNGPLKEGQTLRLQSRGATNLGSSKSHLSFRAKWDLSADADYVQIKASSDGNNFKPLCGVYTRQGTNFQDLNNPALCRNSRTMGFWMDDLSEYLGKHVFLELYFNSTFSGVLHDGFISMILKFMLSLWRYRTNCWQNSPWTNPVNDVLHIRIEDFKISQIQEYNFQLSSPDGKKWVAPLHCWWWLGSWSAIYLKGFYILHTGRNMSQSHSLHFIVNWTSWIFSLLTDSDRRKNPGAGWYSSYRGKRLYTISVAG